VTAEEYLQTLILASKNSSIPPQLSELEFLMRLIKAENGTGPAVF